MELVAECELRGYEILGVDGFFMSERGTQPSMEHSVNFTSGDYIEGLENISIYDYVRDFIKRKGKLGLSFEVVYSKPK